VEIFVKSFQLFLEVPALWFDFFVMKLTENMRAFATVKEFASWLLHVGEGESGEKISCSTTL
jgi:hypothetical protein